MTLLLQSYWRFTAQKCVLKLSFNCFDKTKLKINIAPNKARVQPWFQNNNGLQYEKLAPVSSKNAFITDANTVRNVLAFSRRSIDDRSAIGRRLVGD